jgi:hypothetical protein
MSIEECSNCHEFVLRPITAPDDAVAMCRECMLDFVARMADLGAVVREQEMCADGVN